MPFEVLWGDSGKLLSVRAGDSKLRCLGKVGGLGLFSLRDRNCAVDTEVTEVGWDAGGLDLCPDVSASSDAFPGAQVPEWGPCKPSCTLSSPGSVTRTLDKVGTSLTDVESRRGDHTLLFVCS